MKTELTHIQRLAYLKARKTPGITSSLFLTVDTPRLVLGTTNYKRRNCKRVSLVRPSQLPLPFAYCSVEVFPAVSGVDVRDPDTGRALFHLDCDYDTFEEEWAGFFCCVSGGECGRTRVE